jgi:hypothetical protein
MNPILPTALNQQLPGVPPMYPFTFGPGIFPTIEEGNDFLSSLDSDTRDYVIKHTDEFRSRADIEECIQKLQGKA